MPLSFPGAARAAALVAAATLAVATLAGCADFSEQDHTANAGPFSSIPEGGGGAPETPRTPDPTETGPAPTGPCVDPNPAVIATCLGTTGGVRPADPEGRSTYVAERVTGKIIISKRYGPQRTIATVPVDSSGDGGLIDFELSPTYQQDQLIYALISTGSDNRIVRIAPGNAVKAILTGIPKGATGNMGSISFASPTELRVATGNAGNPGAAGDPGSLAGKVFTIDPNLTNPRPKILASGLGANVALCPDPESGKLYVADSGAAGDRLQQVEPAGLRTLWTWADRPGITGCAVSAGIISVSMARAFRIDSLAAPTNASPSVGQPQTSDVKEQYGAVGRMTSTGSAVQLATINKTVSGAPAKTTNDVVALYAPQSQSDDRR
ncbi:PQQ-dependent sugar dehydrogenase [Gordonia sp. FQ]|uniref:PQQ-dependent sugar dehydrogenase n=1 Tax=Gordonia sp. FQ TaxID=3446634 RepID=UPI003F82ED34